MDKTRLFDLLKNPASLSAKHLPDLEVLASDYPYFQAPHLLIARFDKSQENIGRAALLTADRSVMKRFLLGELDKTEDEFDTLDIDRTEPVNAFDVLSAESDSTESDNEEHLAPVTDDEGHPEAKSNVSESDSDHSEADDDTSHNNEKSFFEETEYEDPDYKYSLSDDESALTSGHAGSDNDDLAPSPVSEANLTEDATTEGIINEPVSASDDKDTVNEKTKEDTSEVSLKQSSLDEFSIKFENDDIDEEEDSIHSDFSSGEYDRIEFDYEAEDESIHAPAVEDDEAEESTSYSFFEELNIEVEKPLKKKSYSESELKDDKFKEGSSFFDDLNLALQPEDDDTVSFFDDISPNGNAGAYAKEIQDFLGIVPNLPHEFSTVDNDLNLGSEDSEESFFGELAVSEVFESDLPKELSEKFVTEDDLKSDLRVRPEADSPVFPEFISKGSSEEDIPGSVKSFFDEVEDAESHRLTIPKEVLKSAKEGLVYETVYVEVSDIEEEALREKIPEEEFLPLVSEADHALVDTDGSVTSFFDEIDLYQQGEVQITEPKEETPQISQDEMPESALPVTKEDNITELPQKEETPTENVRKDDDGANKDVEAKDVEVNQDTEPVLSEEKRILKFNERFSQKTTESSRDKHSFFEEINIKGKISEEGSETAAFSTDEITETHETERFSGKFIEEDEVTFTELSEAEHESFKGGDLDKEFLIYENLKGGSTA